VLRRGREGERKEGRKRVCERKPQPEIGERERERE
jgi:hypothetical protein